jgi:transposase InsO family protein
MDGGQKSRDNQRRAQFRLTVIGHLLASPPPKHELKAALQELAKRPWSDPLTGALKEYSFTTLKRWYYKALKAKTDPVRSLLRERRRDAGRGKVMSPALCEALRRQYNDYRFWSVQLHYDNLRRLVCEHPELGKLPSYWTVRRYLRSNGMNRQRRLTSRRTPGAVAAQTRLDNYEVRSYEVEYVGGLWHLDFHHGSYKVLDHRGEWQTPILCAVIDDHSRLICHAQWYLNETAETLVHCLIQALLKRGLPRALMTDNGSAMIAGETVQGLARLGIPHDTTLPYSPWMNGKVESLWGVVEGRLLAMLEDSGDLNVRQLNDVMLPWLEHDYNRKVHSQTGQTPLQRFLNDRSVIRPCPTFDELKDTFTRSEVRTLRRSDGTISLQGRRFEIPDRFCHFPRLCVRYASWDLGKVYLVDGNLDTLLERLFPVDKVKNANRARRHREPPAPAPFEPALLPRGEPPLLAWIRKAQAASGLPPAYLHHPEPGETESDK